jgi:hypothetical protein
VGVNEFETATEESAAGGECEELSFRDEGHPNEKSKKPIIKKTCTKGEQRKFFVFMPEFPSPQLRWRPHFNLIACPFLKNEYMQNSSG